jgi:hypothetical protein
MKISKWAISTCEKTMISGWLLQHVVSATVAEGGYKSKEEHQA